MRKLGSFYYVTDSSRPYFPNTTNPNTESIIPNADSIVPTDDGKDHKVNP